MCCVLLLCCAAQLKVWRDGQHVELPVQLSTPHQLVPVHSHDLKPHYFIYGGEGEGCALLLLEHSTMLVMFVLHAQTRGRCLLVDTSCARVVPDVYAADVLVPV